MRHCLEFISHRCRPAPFLIHKGYSAWVPPMFSWAYTLLINYPLGIGKQLFPRWFWGDSTDSSHSVCESKKKRAMQSLSLAVVCFPWKNSLDAEDGLSGEVPLPTLVSFRSFRFANYHKPSSMVEMCDFWRQKRDISPWWKGCVVRPLILENRGEWSRIRVIRWLCKVNCRFGSVQPSKFSYRETSQDQKSLRITRTHPEITQWIN